jgi:hypothetical protein
LDALAVVCLLYLTLVGSVAAFLLYYWLVRKVDVTKTMLIALVTPLAAVLLGMVTLGRESDVEDGRGRRAHNVGRRARRAVARALESRSRGRDGERRHGVSRREVQHRDTETRLIESSAVPLCLRWLINVGARVVKHF